MTLTPDADLNVDAELAMTSPGLLTRETLLLVAFIAIAVPIVWPLFFGESS